MLVKKTNTLYENNAIINLAKTKRDTCGVPLFLEKEIKMNETSRFATMTKKVNEFYASNAALWFFMVTTTVFALLQVVLYASNIMQVNGADIESAQELHHVWSNWILLFVSIIGSYCGFIGGIMLFRGSLSFLYWQNASTTLSFLTQALASMWFGAFVSVYFLGMNFIRYYVWKNELLEKWNLSSSTVIAIGLAAFFILLFLMNGMAFAWGDVIYGESVIAPEHEAGWMKPYNFQFDATGAAFNMSASFLMLFKCRWAFVLYAIAKVFTIWNYADAGLIVPIVQMMLFWIMDFTGFIGWSIHAIEESTQINDVNPEFKDI